VNYQVVHDAIIQRARDRAAVLGYAEKHHVIPKSLGGSSKPDNLVRLTFREHFLVHWLLTKLTVGPARCKMQFAMLRLSSRGHQGRIITSWQYAVVRRAQREAAYERPYTESTRRKVRVAMSGRKFSPEHRAALSAAATESRARLTPEERSIKFGNRSGTKQSPRARNKIRIALQDKPKTKEHNAAVGTRARERWADPVYKERMRVSLRQGWIGRRARQEGELLCT
jgi:hypothetical protein